jgi:hypothetical protein
MVWTGLVWLGIDTALVNAVMNLQVSENAWKVPSGCTTCGLLSCTQLHRVGWLVNCCIEPSLPKTVIISRLTEFHALKSYDMASGKDMELLFHGLVGTSYIGCSTELV